MSNIISKEQTWTHKKSGDLTPYGAKIDFVNNFFETAKNDWDSILFYFNDRIFVLNARTTWIALDINDMENKNYSYEALVYIIKYMSELIEIARELQSEAKHTKSTLEKFQEKETFSPEKIDKMYGDLVKILDDISVFSTTIEEMQNKISTINQPAIDEPSKINAPEPQKPNNKELLDLEPSNEKKDFEPVNETPEKETKKENKKTKSIVKQKRNKSNNAFKKAKEKLSTIKMPKIKKPSEKQIKTVGAVAGGILILAVAMLSLRQCAKKSDKAQIKTEQRVPVTPEANAPTSSIVPTPKITPSDWLKIWDAFTEIRPNANGKNNITVDLLNGDNTFQDDVILFENIDKAAFDDKTFTVLSDNTLYVFDRMNGNLINQKSR